jgi:glycosyltransferase involved in cell wall biosynthesis
LLPLVSIITPSLNCGAYIEETLRSVAQQDYPRVEHIVLDSGSTDETLAILASYPSVRLVTAAPHGVSAKVNHGFSIARGEIIGWLNADDFYLPGAISKAVDSFKRNPGVAVVYGNLVQVDEHSVELDERERTRQAGWQEMLARQYVPLCSAFVRREALERVGPLDMRYPLVQDWDMWLRISKQFAMLYVDDWWGAFRVREGQHSDLYKYDLWVQSRKMTKEHGARFLPLFRDYWGTKLGNAGRMILNGEFGRLRSKLCSYIRSFGRHHIIRNRSDY